MYQWMRARFRECARVFANARAFPQMRVRFRECACVSANVRAFQPMRARFREYTRVSANAHAFPQMRARFRKCARVSANARAFPRMRMRFTRVSANARAFQCLFMRFSECACDLVLCARTSVTVYISVTSHIRIWVTTCIHTRLWHCCLNSSFCHSFFFLVVVLSILINFAYGKNLNQALTNEFLSCLSHHRFIITTSSLLGWDELRLYRLKTYNVHMRHKGTEEGGGHELRTI